MGQGRTGGATEKVIDGDKGEGVAPVGKAE